MKRSFLIIVLSLITAVTFAQYPTGGKYKDFTSRTPDGKELSLSSIAGKDNWILVDFWASWCVYCRRDNPNLLKAYEKFHDKGFEIISLSLDKNRDEWLSAVKEDNMSWINVSDPETSSAVARMYSVRYIPSNILINPEGIIVKSNIPGKELIEFLEETLN